ncbi:hypothetical protein LZ31DRAFT_551948 [Colletotrichum somersetense]|nr:hypothetical protein LZ31DRAFT_551948 [Colletotrichum somersetense]
MCNKIGINSSADSNHQTLPNSMPSEPPKKPDWPGKQLIETHAHTYTPSNQIRGVYANFQCD